MTRLLSPRAETETEVRSRSVAAPPSRLATAARVFGPLTLFLTAIWAGLVTANLELFVFWARWRFVDRTALSSLQLNQYAPWMVPLSDALIFSLAGFSIALVARLTRSRWAVALGVYGLCFLSAYALLLTYRGLSSLACSALAIGLAFRISGPILRRPEAFRRVMLVSLPGLLGVAAVSWAVGPVSERITERTNPPARPGSPNVLFIVLDTVRAENLSLHGYGRPTSRFLEGLAQGRSFDQARSAAPWTLPSHATMFTGRLPHELSTRLDRPLDDSFPTLAEFLRDHGYDTAGFVANTFFCSRWFGLARGFVHYEDVAIDLDEILRTSGLGRALSRKFQPAGNDRPTAYFERKDAKSINAEFLAWLDRRPSGRPFFAFLNYYDAHDPYLAPEDQQAHLGCGPKSARDLEVLRDWHRRSRGKVAPDDVQLARDSYDRCLAYLDGQLEALFRSLEARALMENTLVVVTSDHGEEFGEHSFFGHGQHLYSQVLHVPLLIIGPGRIPAERSVAAPVSLRDLPATLVNLLGLADSSPFPGRSLARHWAGPAAASSGRDDPVLSEIDDDDGRFREGPPSRAIVDEGLSYIRLGEGGEELYDLIRDPGETRNLAGEPSFQAALARLRLLAEGVRGTGEHDTPAEPLASSR